MVSHYMQILDPEPDLDSPRPSSLFAWDAWAVYALAFTLGEIAELGIAVFLTAGETQRNVTSKCGSRRTGSIFDRLDHTVAQKEHWSNVVEGCMIQFTWRHQGLHSISGTMI